MAFDPTKKDDTKYTAVPVLSKVKIGDKYYYLKDADARLAVDSILEDYLKGADKTELDSKITALAARVTTIEGDYVTEADLVAAVKVEADRAKDAEAALDGRLDVIEGDATTVGSIKKAVADEAAARDTAISAAINALDVDDTAETGKYVSAVKEVDGKIEVTRETLPTAPEYTIVKQASPESEMAATYYLTKSGTQVGEKINIPKDQFLKEAHFCKTATDVPAGHTAPTDTEFPAILFVFTTKAGDVDTWVSVKDLVDVYTAGDGIDITGNEISAVAKTGDKYIKVTADGIASEGIDTAIADAVAAEAELRETADSALDERLDVIEGDDTVDGSIKKALKDAKAYTDAETTRATGVEGGLNTRLTTAEGKITTIEGKPAYDITSNQITNWDNEVGAKAAIAAEVARATAAEASKEDKSNLKALAYADSASGTVAGQTISGVKATGNISGTATIAATDATVTSSGEYTPAGNVTGSVVAAGSVTLNDLTQTSTAATLTKADYTPAGSVTVNTANVTASKVKNAGTVASFTEGAFTPNVPTVIDTSKFNGGAPATWTGATYTAPSLGTATTDTFVKEGLVATVGATGSADEECLIFTAATTATAVTAQGAFDGGNVNFGTFDGGSAASLGTGFYTAGSAASKAADTFNGGAMPTFDEVTAHTVTDASFAGTKAENALVTGVSYDKATANGASFTGSSATITATFAGTADTISVDGTYKKITEGDAAVTVTGAELNVGDIVVAAKDVTVTPTVSE